MGTIVLVHGGRHGGWCWKAVASRLRGLGHEVYAPSLPGSGEHARGATETIDLSTHIADVADLMTYEDLREVVLVGHSYAGMVITAAPDSCDGRVGGLVYLDALVPLAGESVFDLMVPEIAVALRAALTGQDPDWLIPVTRDTPTPYGVTDPSVAAWLEERLTPQPLRTYEQPLPPVAVAPTLRRTYVRCTKSTMIAGSVVDRARLDPGWTYRELDAPHDAMLTHPTEVAGIIHTAWSSCRQMRVAPPVAGD